MDAAVAAREYERWAALNRDLHRAVNEIARMPLLGEMTDRVLARWERLRRHYFQGVLVPRVEQAQAEHRELLAALVGRDADLAERIVRQHNRAAQRSYAEYLRKHPPEPVPPGPA
jgi:DNA-binding GntR family transcriptional regulator